MLVKPKEPNSITEALAITGWMSEPELRWLAECASNHRHIIEVGCFIGRTTKVLANNTLGHVWCVDTWQPDWFLTLQENDIEASKIARSYPSPLKNFCDNLALEIANLRVKCFVGDMFSFRQRSKFINPDFYDMIFIDAAHDYHHVKTDIFDALDLVSPGGLICGHDYGEAIWPDVKRAVDDIFGADNIVNPVGTIWYRKT